MTEHHYNDDNVTELVAAVSKLYATSVIAEVAQAAAKLSEIRRRYETELTEGPAQWALLLETARRWDVKGVDMPTERSRALKRWLVAAEVVAGGVRRG